MGRDRDGLRDQWDVGEHSLSLIYSDRSEHLLDALAQVIFHERQQSALNHVDVVVPHRDVETWCRMGLAKRLGVIANVEFMLPPRFFRRIASAVSPSPTPHSALCPPRPIRLVDRELLLEHLLFLFFSPKATSLPLEVKRYLGDVKSDSSALSRGSQLARHLSELFSNYDEATDFLTRWQRGESIGFLPGSAQEEVEAWQSELWRLIRGRMDQQSDRLVSLSELSEENLCLPHATFFFALPTMPLAHLRILDALWKLTDRPNLKVFAFNPCCEDWNDIRDRRSLAGLRFAEVPPPSKSQSAKDDEEELEGDDHPMGGMWRDRDEDESNASGRLLGNPLLMSLGKAGREHVRALNELSDFNFEEAFSETEPGREGGDPLKKTVPTLLEQIQSDIRNNVIDPLPWPPSDLDDVARASAEVDKAPSASELADGSIQILSCTGVRRECEAVAEKVLALFQRDRDLQFGDVAILVASRMPKPYFTGLLASLKVLGVPVSCNEFWGTRASRLPEAAERLIRLPLSELTRGDVMDVLSHPCLLANVPALDRTCLARLVDDLGIFYDLDSKDQKKRHGVKYLSTDVPWARTQDLFNWRQGLKRIALGHAMWSAECDGGEVLGNLANQPFVQTNGLNGTRYWPANLPGELRHESMLWLQMVQSLLADVEFAAEGNRPGGPWQTVRDWSVFMEALIDTYLVAQKGEEDQKAALLRTARQLRHVFSIYDFESGREVPVPYSVAAALFLEKLSALRDELGHFLLDGVSVSGLFRVIPARHVFIVGLNSGEFPEQASHDQLDLSNVPLKKLRRDGLGGSRADSIRRFVVTSQERDRYLFLQELMEARQSLVLSFQGRDQQTGEAKDPSSPLSDVERVLSAYLPHRASDFRTVVTPRRCDLENFPALQNLVSDGHLPQVNDLKVAAQQDVSKGTDAMGEAVALSLREILKSCHPEAMSRGGAATTLTNEDNVKSLFQTKSLKPFATPSEEILASVKLFNLNDPKDAPESAHSKRSDEQPLSTWNVRISSLAKFLEDPAQGSAAGRLGLWSENEDDTNDARFHRSDEAFSLNDPLLVASLIQEFVQDYVIGTSGIDGPWSGEIWEITPSLERRVVRGIFPAGIFGERAQQSLLTKFEALSEHLQEAMDVAAHPRAEMVVHQFWLGPSASLNASITPLNALKLPHPVEVLGQSYAVNVTGKLQLIGTLKGQPNQVIALQFKNSKPEAPIRAFVSAMAYVAVQDAPSETPFSLVCGCIGGSDPRFELYRSTTCGAVTVSEARDFLAQLSAQMLSGPNDYWMPAAKVVACLKKKNPLEEIEKALAKNGDRLSFGPLSPDKVASLRLPTHEELTCALNGRWGFFAQRMEKVAKPRRSSRSKRGEAS